MGILLSLNGGVMKPMWKGGLLSDGASGTRFAIASSAFVRGPGEGDAGTGGGFSE